MADAPSGAIKNKITSPKVALKSFDLQDVKLLPGPFETARELNSRYLLELSADRLLHNFHKNAGLEPKAPIYGGWEAAGVAGHTLGHYLTALSEEYRSTNNSLIKERLDYLVAELARCQDKIGTGYVAGIPESERIWSEIESGNVRASGFDLNGGWVPWYTLHKLFAGLRDAHTIGGNAQAKTVLIKLSDWAIHVTRNLDEKKWQQMLICEHGGMNEVMGDVYALTGEEKYLTLARHFDHKFVLDPLRAKQDRLAGLHGNTQIPKVIGLARLYELTGNQSDRTAAQFFWERVTKTRSFVIGGNSEHEHLSAPNEISKHLGTTSAETCNTYNMLKLTRHLNEWTGEASYFDFYERALYNHILASQDPQKGMFTYYVSLKPGHFKTYSMPTSSFWCCVGTGIENHAKYNEAIYAHDADSLYVNLFIPSEVKWKEKNVTISQTTKFPSAGSASFRFAVAKPTKAGIKIRVPVWSEKTNFKINGKTQKVASRSGSYALIRREWKQGDTLEVTFDMQLRVEPTPDDANKVAILYGPIVLAAQLGRDGMPEQRVSSQMDLGGIADPPVPVLVTTDAIEKHITPIPGQDLAFRLANIARLPGDDTPTSVVLKPFHQTAFERYTVYFDSFTPNRWADKQAEYRVEAERVRDLVARTVDEYRPGEQQSEVDHGMKSQSSHFGAALGRTWRDASDGGWFEFNLKVDSDTPQDLILTYWGSDANGREFDILVDGETIGSESLRGEKPDQFFDRTYPLPATLLQGKTSVKVRLQAKPNRIAGGLFGARIARRKQ